MKKHRIEGMTKGWFVGDFSPTLHATREFEAAVKFYKAGDHEPAHYHKVAKEFTVVVTGVVSMNGEEFVAGDIVEVNPGDVVEFRAVTDAATAVVKVPSVAGDKYPATK